MTVDNSNKTEQKRAPWQPDLTGKTFEAPTRNGARRFEVIKAHHDRGNWLCQLLDGSGFCAVLPTAEIQKYLP